MVAEFTPQACGGTGSEDGLWCSNHQTNNDERKVQVNISLVASTVTLAATLALGAPIASAHHGHASTPQTPTDAAPTCAAKADQANDRPREKVR